MSITKNTGNNPNVYPCNNMDKSQRIILSFKKKKVQKITCCMITFVGYSRKGKTQEIEIRWVSASSWGLG